MTIIKKTVGDNKKAWDSDNKKAWDSKIKYELWADRITKLSSTGKSPFELVYGLDVTLPIHLKLPVYHLLQNFSSDQDAIHSRVNQLIELDENRRKSLDQSIRNSDKIKRTFDKSTKPRSFQVGDTILLWDKQREKPGKHGKFDSLWMGPYIIDEVAGANSFYLNDLEGERLNLRMNGLLLKMFFTGTISCLYWHRWYQAYF